MSLPRVATIGFGFLGKWHAQKAHALDGLCDFRAIVETFPQGQEAARTAYPQIKVVSHLADVMPEIDAAIVVTPTSMHHAMVKELLMGGKHVFCEKPLCSTSAQARELEALASEKKLYLQVGHSERCHAAWETLRPRFLKMAGPLSLRLDRFAPFKGRATDVDVVQDLMIHDIDLMLWLFNRNPLRVRAWGHKIRTDNWDHVTAHFSLENGAEAIITVGRNHTHEARALEVMNQQGMVRVDLFANKIQVAPAGEVSPGVFTTEESYSKRDHLLLEQEAFYRTISTGVPLMVNAAEGRRAVEWVEAVLKSLESGEVVTLHG